MKNQYSAMNAKQFFLAVEQKKIVPFYLFSGDSEFLKEEGIKRLLSSLLSPELVPFNYDICYGGEVSGKDIVEKAATFPVLSEWRVVVVKDAHRLSASDREAIAAYAAGPVSHTCMVLVVPVTSGKDKISQILTGRVEAVLFSDLPAGHLPRWIMERGRQYGVKVTSRAAYDLAKRVGGNLSLLSHELDKLLNYVGKGSTITPEHVALLTEEVRVNSLFALTDAIGEKNGLRALFLLKQLSDEGKKAPEIIGLLLWHLRRLWRIRSALDHGETISDILSTFRIPFPFRKKAAAQVRKISQNKLREDWHLILQADLAIKSGRMAPLLALELLVYRLCS